MPKLAIRLQNVDMLLEGEIPPEVREDIRRRMSYIVPGHEFMPGFKKSQMSAKYGGGEAWDGTKTVAIWQRGGGLKAPTGLLSYLRECLTEHGLEYSIIDERPVPVPSAGWDTPGLKLRDYQLDQMVAPMLNKQRGVLKASTGCHRAGQLILMFDGSLKKVEDILVGDQLMGPDSTPRNVKKLFRGKGTMYKIVPTKGKSFVVNEDHILSLQRTNLGLDEKRKSLPREIDISVKDYLHMSKSHKHYYKLFRVPVDFSEIQKPAVDPYFLGLLLGDGILSSYVGLCNKHPAMHKEIKYQAKKWNLKISDYTYNGTCPILALVSKTNNFRKYKNPLVGELKKLKLFKTNCESKFIPFEYKTGSVETRQQVLAGLMDTDGNYSDGFDYVSKSEVLANDVAFVARSLGLAAYVKPCQKSCQTGAVGDYFRVSISGHIEMTPCRIPYKKPKKRKQIKTVLRTGFKAIKLPKKEKFFGFELDKDHRYLLDDFTVTHNSGKTEVMVNTIVKASCFPAIFYVTSCDLLRQAKARFEKYVTYNGKPAKIGVIGDSKCDIQPITIATVQSCQKALEGSYTKYTFDDFSSDDETEFDERQKGQIKDFIKEAQFVYVDEAHHVSSETVQCIMKASLKARFRIGGSASPWRDDGLDILIEACFGKRLCDISASFLIDMGFLVKPIITFNHFRQALGTSGNFQSHYTKYVVENEPRNQFIAQRAIHHVGLDRPTIVLVKFVSHAERLKELIPGSEILASSGKAKKTPKQREAYLNQMRSRELKCIIATSLLDEGVDVPAASAAIFAGGGKSSTRELQRVGRVIRPDPNDPNKDRAWIEEFSDHTKWLNHHAKERRRILETEKSFEIVDNKSTMIL